MKNTQPPNSSANKGYLIQNGSGEVIYAFGAKDDTEALRTALEHMGEQLPWTLTHVRLVTRPIVHEHVEIYRHAIPQDLPLFKTEEKQAGAKTEVYVNGTKLKDVENHINSEKTK